MEFVIFITNKELEYFLYANNILLLFVWYSNLLQPSFIIINLVINYLFLSQIAILSSSQIAAN